MKKMRVPCITTQKRNKKWKKTEDNKINEQWALEVHESSQKQITDTKGRKIKGDQINRNDPFDRMELTDDEGPCPEPKPIRVIIVATSTNPFTNLSVLMDGHRCHPDRILVNSLRWKFVHVHCCSMCRSHWHWSFRSSTGRSWLTWHWSFRPVPWSHTR